MRSPISGIWNAAVLAGSDERDDREFSACAEGPAACYVGGAASGEDGQEQKFESIRLSLANGWSWTELWVSSRDSSTDSPEPATLQLGSSHSIKGDLPDDAGGSAPPQTGGSLFENGGARLINPPDVPRQDTGEPAPGSGPNPRANIPEPASLLLLGFGLAAAALSRRRRNAPRV
jgi:hypothetical protein